VRLAVEIACAAAAAPVPPLGDAGAVDVRDLRVGVFTDDGIFPASPAVKRAVETAAEALAARGARVEAFAPPDVPQALALIFGIFSADRFAGMLRTLGRDPLDRRLRGLAKAVTAPAALLPVLRRLLAAGGRGRVAALLGHRGRGDADHYFRLVEQQLDLQERFAAALDRAPGGPIDVLLSPAFALPAVRHGATEELGLTGAYGALYNVLGYPAGVVPVTRVRAGEEAHPGRGRDKMDRVAAASERGSAGLPVGVQVAARPFADHVALAAMAALEAEVRTRSDFPATPIDVAAPEAAPHAAA